MIQQRIWDFGSRLLLLAALCVSSSAVVEAATYYVAKNTSGTACSQALPCPTIAAGLARMSGGDTLIIGDGTYAEYIHDTIPSGSSGAPTTIQAQNRNQAILMPPAGDPNNYNSLYYVIHLVNRHYITIDGIVADASYIQSYPYRIYRTTLAAGDPSDGTSSHIILKNGTARNGHNNYSSGITVAGSDHQILNMDSHDNGRPPFDDTVNTPSGHGIYVSGQRITVDGNRFYRNGNDPSVFGYGIQIYHSGATDVDDNIFRNNVVHDNGYGTIIASGDHTLYYNNILYDNKSDGIQIKYGGNDAKVYNNTLYGNTGTCIRNLETINQIKNNICLQNGSDSIADESGISSSGIAGNLCGTSGSGCSIIANPRFVNAAGRDFHLQSNSPAIDAGMDVGISTDFEENDRPAGAGYDIGAYEYGGTSSASRCDLNASGATDALDLQSLVNAILVGSSASANDLNRDGLVNVQDAQVMVNVILGTGSCPL